VRLGLIGCGGMGRRHALALNTLRGLREDLDVVAVLDRDPARAGHIAQLLRSAGHRPVVTKDLNELIDLVDAVDVVLPTALHSEYVARALDSGRHVLVEKPLTLEARHAWELAHLAESRGVVLAVAENFRRIPANRALHHLLDSEALGRPQYMRTQVRAATWGELSADAGAWYRDASVSGSYAVFELGAHEMDLAQYFFGDVETVYATAVGEQRSAAEAENVLITLGCAAGVQVQIAISVSSSALTFAAREVVCSSGRALSGNWEAWTDGSFETDTGDVVSSASFVDAYIADLEPDDARLPKGTFSPGPPYLDRAVPLRYGIVSALDDFVTAVATGRPPEVDGFAGAKTVAVCEAVLQSIRTGLPVRPLDYLIAEPGKV
jgi:predicted dehydrogenase